MAADRPEGPAPTMSTSRTDILTDNNAHMKKYAALAAVLALVVASPRAQGRRLITEKDLFKFTWIADPQISPDGAAVAFVRVTVNEKENRYETALYIVAASGGGAPRPPHAGARHTPAPGAPRPLTAGVGDPSPRWASGGRRIACVRAAERDGKPLPPQIYVLQMDGG